MRQSKLFGKTIKESPKDEVSVNADLLYRAGFVEKLMSGVYSYLPMGLRVLEKIKNIIREELNAIECQEMLMPALQPKELWDETGRWDALKEIMFQFKGHGDADVGLAATHEETITDIVRKRIQSYKDLPLALYQIQDKFRNEPRAKSGILRGREFSMKDLYSFHVNEAGLNEFYDKVKIAYLKIFARCGLDAAIVEASGGAFSEEYSHEFQVFCDNGEDTVRYCPNGDFAQNVEIAKAAIGDACPVCGEKIMEVKAIEVGNIFLLKDKYSKSMKAYFMDEKGERSPIIMGCYGIGPSRTMGTIVEKFHDDKGIIWPKEVAPYQIHLISLGDSADVIRAAETVYNQSLDDKLELLYDDRAESAGKKLMDSDLMGIPNRLIISEKTLANNQIELKERAGKEVKLMTSAEALALLKD